MCASQLSGETCGMNDFRHFYESAPFGSVPQEYEAWCEERADNGKSIVTFGEAAQAIREMIESKVKDKQ